MAIKIEQVKSVLLKNARVVDPQVKLDQITDILIEKDIIRKIGPVREFKGKTVDCKNKIVIPGMMDMHVHLREPGEEHKETVITGCHAAAAGGFTELACMPNTKPPIDCRSDVEFIKERAENHLVNVHPIAAVTIGQAGEQLTEMGDMIEAGAAGFSDDGKPVLTAALMRRALEYATMLGKPVIDHCEDLSLSESGVMHEGKISAVLGMPSIPSIAEEIIVARDLLIAEYTEGLLHLAHISTAGAVRLIREAKSRGVRVTAETCPHYLVLTDEAVRGFNTLTKMNPPLRSENDQKMLIRGLKDGTIDTIATDHAPHAIEDKECEFQVAAFGIIGLETAFGLIWTHLVEKKLLTLEELILKMSVHPRQILQLPENKIESGAPANLTLVDPDIMWTVDNTAFESKSKNMPFQDWKLKGKTFGVINRGKMILTV
ncbi:dihydroorotase [bacterium]|nr:dihydroorotase [bacterium]